MGRASKQSWPTESTTIFLCANHSPICYSNSCCGLHIRSDIFWVWKLRICQFILKPRRTSCSQLDRIIWNQSSNACFGGRLEKYSNSSPHTYGRNDNNSTRYLQGGGSRWSR